MNVDQAHTVGAPDAQPPLLCNRMASDLQSLSLRTGFSKAGGLDDHAPYPFLGTLLQGFGNRRGRDEDDSQVDLYGDIEDAAIADLFVYPVHPGIHRIEIVSETGLHVPEKLVPGSSFVAGGPDQCNPLRVKE